MTRRRTANHIASPRKNPRRAPSSCRCPPSGVAVPDVLRGLTQRDVDFIFDTLDRLETMRGGDPSSQHAAMIRTSVGALEVTKNGLGGGAVEVTSTMEGKARSRRSLRIDDLLRGLPGVRRPSSKRPRQRRRAGGVRVPKGSRVPDALRFLDGADVDDLVAAFERLLQMRDARPAMDVVLTGVGNIRVLKDQEGRGSVEMLSTLNGRDARWRSMSLASLLRLYPQCRGVPLNRRSRATR